MKKIITNEKVSPSPFHTIMAGAYSFIAANNYWPTIALLSESNYEKTLTAFSQRCYFDSPDKLPIGNSFKIQMNELYLRIIICHEITDDEIQFH